MILDLRIPKSAQYQGVVLDTAVAQFLAGELTRDQTMQQIEQGWEKITDEEERDKQKEAYASSLNIQR
jgi:multiple sugar transport system substrate-binding protein